LFLFRSGKKTKPLPKVFFKVPPLHQFCNKYREIGNKKYWEKDVIEN
jgi:hypothetical protein